MHTKYVVTIRAHARHNNPERIALMLRVSLHSMRREFSCGFTINKSEWDTKTKRVVNREDAMFINSSIANTRKVLEDIIIRYELIEKKLPTLDEISKEFLKMDGRVEEKHEEVITPPAYQSIDDFIRDGKQKKGWSYSTGQKFQTLQDHLKHWKENLRFADINDDSLYEFQSWCKDVLGHRNTTLQKYSGFLRWWLNWAKDKGLYQGTSGKTFRPHYKGGDFQFKEIIYLDREELKRLEEHDFTRSPHLDHARDLFVFSCYCGLRYSDVARLRKSNIVDGNIVIVTKKTDDRLSIPLNSHTKAILAKYKDSEHGQILPVMSNQKVNDYIKECCRVVGINSEVELTHFEGARKVTSVHSKSDIVTFHAARRTFITLAFDLGIPTEVIMKFSGHKKIEMLKPYMEIMEQKKKDEMSKFDEL